MGSIVRLFIGIPVAIIITFGLFMLMRTLISVDEVEFEEAGEDLTFDITQEVEELNARTRDTSIDDVQQVDPPPPPPQVERQAADLPSESLSTIVGNIPEFDTPELNSGNVSFNVSDRDAQPLVRIPPQYPVRAAERGTEGYCDMTFNVSPDGTPVDIQATYCTSSLFERSSVRAVERWRYSQRIVDGVPQMRRGVVTRIEYELAD
ncbi:energy transducer TonB [Hyphobacterium sp. HN65]|uniref:Energy transducer TonB n=1 Tax=Hyphobacterium lacteum TaxID=3116575 RepID=A0ABU7LSW9_9PROT|nr:energy transducer TonB [Hyphobacterium sp. HN65]MEE2527021.1 energy transducer TonB [Hyphobacterium sp. HN65]